jgi:hypothetical protein
MFDERPDIDFLFDGTFAEAVNYSVAIAILVAGGLSILFFFFGGIQFITSGGDEEKSKKAVVTIRYSIIGLLVVIFSVTFVSLFGAIFNLNIMEPLRWDTIVESIQEMSEKLKAMTEEMPSEQENTLN